MARSKKDSPGLEKVQEALELLTIDELKPLVALLPTKEQPSRKGELVALMESYLAGEHLRAVWQQLDKTQQLAVSETVWSADGVFRPERFKAKYGALPVFGTKKENRGYGETPSRLRLFIYRLQRYGGPASVIPADLRQQLRSFVPQPAAPALPAVDDLPGYVELAENEYEWQPDDTGITLITPRGAYQMPRKPPQVRVKTRQIPLLRRDTEREALQDVQTVLRLIDTGKIAVSDKTLQPGAATMEEIAALLRNGDFYPAAAKKTRQAQDIGPLKAFAWPLLVQAARLAELSGRKLALTAAGRRALGAAAADTLRLLWQRWGKSKLLDEFRRIATVKGQGGKGARSMTALEGRRAVITAALQQCPVGKWVQFDAFSRFMQAASFDFEVTREPWDLYIEDPQYGSLGYEGYHDWDIVQARYLLCLLFEYAATLGMLDVAYIAPAGARNDFRRLWGTDDLDCFSRYDGLMYFRLNPLGAYCLGLTAQYVPSQVAVRSALTVLPSLRINVTGAALAPDEKLLLDTWAEQEAETVWRLDRSKALSAVESGQQVAELRSFLAARDTQPLPETVEGFLQNSDRQARALTTQGTAVLIACAEAEIAALIASHAHTKTLCLRAGERHLAVPIEAIEQFRKAIHELGYGMPRV